MARATWHALTDKVAELSGKPVDVREDPALQVLATVRIGRGDVPAHTILFAPGARAFSDYLICGQCGYLLRLYAAPVAERYDLAASTDGEHEVARLIRQKFGGAGLIAPALNGLRDHMLSGLIRRNSSAVCNVCVW